MIHASKRMELFFLAMLPAIITTLLTIFSVASKHITGLDRFMPILALIPVFYWGMAQTRDMPYWFLFVLGILIDSVTGLPLGSTSLEYMLFLILLQSQRKYIHKEGFVIKWGFFAGLLAAASLFNWASLSFFYSHMQIVLPVLIQWLLTVCCYPVLHKFFDGIYEHIHSRRWQILHGHG